MCAVGRHMHVSGVLLQPVRQGKRVKVAMAPKPAQFSGRDLSIIAANHSKQLLVIVNSR